MSEDVMTPAELEIPVLPSLDDVEHPVLKRAVERVQDLLADPTAKAGYNKHHNRHDRGSSPYW